MTVVQRQDVAIQDLSSNNSREGVQFQCERPHYTILPYMFDLCVDIKHDVTTITQNDNFLVLYLCT